MKMKKTKLIVIFGVMLLLFTGMAMAVTDSEEAILGTGENVVTAKNEIYIYTASASINVTQSCSAGLDSTYTAINPTTLTTYSERKYGSDQWGYKANYSAKDGYRSVKIVTSFSVTYGRQSWKANITTVR